MSRIALIGCGNIGYRHLQAIASVPSVEEIVVVEPNEARRAECLTGTLKPPTAARLLGVSSVEGLVPGGTFQLLISAVTADVQGRVVQSLRDVSVETVLLEKPVAQGRVALDQIVAGLGERRVFVNCPRGYWLGYQRIREMLSALPHQRFRFEATGNAWGLACNAVHFLELGAFLTGDRFTKVASTQIADSPTGNKRGDRYEEWVGTAAFENARGDCLQLTSGHAGPKAMPCVVSIRDRGTGALLAVSDETANQVCALAPGTASVFPLGLAHVSQTSARIVEDLGAGRSLLVPSLVEAGKSHEALFDALEQHTGRRVFAIT